MNWIQCDLMQALTVSQRRVLEETIPSNQPSLSVARKARCTEELVKAIRRERVRIRKAEHDHRRNVALDAVRMVDDGSPWPEREGTGRDFLARLVATYGARMPA